MARPKLGLSSDRVFAVAGTAAGGTEVELWQVLTWASREALEEGLLAGLPMMSKVVVLAEMRVPLQVGARLPVGSPEAWPVRLGNDRVAAPLVAGALLWLLEAEFKGAGNAKVWWLWPRVVERLRLEAAGAGLALASLDGA